MGSHVSFKLEQYDLFATLYSFECSCSLIQYQIAIKLMHVHMELQMSDALN
jgi:hypothetical protein